MATYSVSQSQTYRTFINYRNNFNTRTNPVEVSYIAKLAHFWANVKLFVRLMSMCYFLLLLFFNCIGMLLAIIHFFSLFYGSKIRSLALYRHALNYYWSSHFVEYICLFINQLNEYCFPARAFDIFHELYTKCIQSK